MQQMQYNFKKKFYSIINIFKSIILKVFSMKIKKSSSFLAALVISALMFTFTACEDDPTPVGEIPAPVTGLAAGQISDNMLQIQWTHSADKNESWFKQYEVTITNSANSGSQTEIVAKGSNYLNYTVPTANATYTFKVVAVNTDDQASTSASISWALAKHFTKTENDTPIDVYCKESVNYGSGLQLYGPNSAPRIRRVANGTDWNLAVGSKNNLIIGSAVAVASAASYNLTGTPSDNFLVTAPMNWSTNTLDDAMEQSLDKLNYSNTSINLTSGIAQSASEGIVFFAKGNASNNYARIVVLKTGGSYVQNASSTDPYVRVLISYQTRAGVPYAKTGSGK